jgi:S-adenosylmethionine-diacylgycerolhomoserine-N-methlytransferase
MSAVLSPEAHAELMDRIYRPQRHVYDFTRKYYLLGRDRLIAGLALQPGAKLIEVGCGTGRNMIAIARAYPDAQLYGLDASEAMLETARIKIRQAGLQHRITLKHALAEQLSVSAFGTTAFEHVLFSYSLSMIPDWPRAIEASIAALSKSGRWHVVDFADFRGLGVLAPVMTAWLRLFHVKPRVEFLSALESLRGAIGNLTLLGGRYAFVFCSRPKADWEICPSSLWRADNSPLIKP